MPNGTVIHPRDFRPAEQLNAYLVTACEDCVSGKTARFTAFRKSLLRETGDGPANPER